MEPDTPEPGWPDRLRRAREVAEITQTEMAHRLHIAQSQYNRYERGRQVPGGARLVAIARILGVTAEWILHGEDSPMRRELDPPHWQEFLANYPHMADLSDAEVQAVRNMFSPVFKVASWTDWVILADFVRSHRG